MSMWLHVLIKNADGLVVAGARNASWLVTPTLTVPLVGPRRKVAKNEARWRGGRHDQAEGRPIIQALADWAVDDALASHDAGYPSRKRLPREHYKRKLAEEAPTPIKPKAKARKRKS
jgi:hypothetical protein